jgi:hypothetical protein
MSQEFGVWSQTEGGFVEDGFWSKVEAQVRAAELNDEVEDDEEHTVLEICPDHEGEPANACEECHAEGNNT